MSTQDQPEIVKLLDYADDDMGVCTLQVLAVVMLVDEEDTPEEKTLLDRIAKNSGLEDIVIEDIILLARKRAVPSIELACEALREGLDPEGQQRFLELCIGMVTADGYVTIPEQHILRFLADLFSIGFEQLHSTYRSVVGSDLPPLGDPSSPDWWANQTNGQHDHTGRKKERRQKRARQNQQTSSEKASSAKDRRAYAILGLDPGASKSEIKDAYRLLAKVHHPDRFERLDDEAVNAANERFRQIKDAYNHLT